MPPQVTMWGYLIHSKTTRNKHRILENKLGLIWDSKKSLWDSPRIPICWDSRKKGEGFYFGFYRKKKASDSKWDSVGQMGVYTSLTETLSEVIILTEHSCFSAMLEVFVSRELKNQFLSSIWYTKPIWESILRPWALGVIFWP